MSAISRFLRGAVIIAAGLWLSMPMTRAAQAQSADELYKKNCTICHGPSGKGDGAAGKMLKPPPADLGTVLKGQADADIAKIIKEGGKAVGKSAAMPAFSGKLSDDQINDLVQLIKGFAAQ